MNMTADFQYKVLFNVDGKADIKIHHIGIDVEADFSLQKGQNTTEMAPKVAIPKVNVEIDPKNVEVKLSGGLVSKIAGVFIPFIKGTLIP